MYRQQFLRAQKSSEQASADVSESGAVYCCAPHAPPQDPGGGWSLAAKRVVALAASCIDMLSQARTKMINATNEKQAAAKCFQNQEKLFLTDIKVGTDCVHPPPTSAVASGPCHLWAESVPTALAVPQQLRRAWGAKRSIAAITLYCGSTMSS